MEWKKSERQIKILSLYSSQLQKFLRWYNLELYTYKFIIFWISFEGVTNWL